MVNFLYFLLQKRDIFIQLHTKLYYFYSIILLCIGNSSVSYRAVGVGGSLIVERVVQDKGRKRYSIPEDYQNVTLVLST